MIELDPILLCLCGISGLNRIARPHPYLISLLIMDVTFGWAMSKAVTGTDITFFAFVGIMATKEFVCWRACCSFDIQTKARARVRDIYLFATILNICLMFSLFNQFYTQTAYIYIFTILTLIQIYSINAIDDNSEVTTP